jgi:hypothetical protein
MASEYAPQLLHELGVARTKMATPPRSGSVFCGKEKEEKKKNERSGVPTPLSLV